MVTWVASPAADDYCLWSGRQIWRGLIAAGRIAVIARARDTLGVHAAGAAGVAGTRRTTGDWDGVASEQASQADAAREAGDLAGAEEHLRAALSLYVMLEDSYSAARTLTSLGDLRFIAGDYTGAAELNRQAVERIPGDAKALTGLAYAEWRAGSPADAELTFSQVLSWESDTAAALAGRGQVRADLGNYAAALDDLDRALKLPLDRDTEADARSARALALAGLGRVTEGRTELAASLRIDPDRARSRLRAGRIAALAGRGDEAREEIERALKAQPALSRDERDSAKRLLARLR